MLTKKLTFLVTGALLASAVVLRFTLAPSMASGAMRAGQQVAASGAKAPELGGRAEDWLNTNGKAVRLYEGNNKTTGKVTVLTFWTHGCINCKRTLPFWNDWAKRYNNTNVSVVSVHTPETTWERSPDAVRKFSQEKKLRFPIVIDNDSKIWNAYNVQAWPTTILIDKQGRIRARWEGELDYDSSREYKRVEAAIETLRKEP